MTARTPGADEAMFWRSPARPGLELMRARWVRHAFPKHTHDWFTIGVNLEGSGVFDCRGSSHLARRGRLNLIAPGEVHTGRAAGPSGWTYVDFYIDPDHFRRLADEAEAPRVSGFRRASIEDPDLARRFLRAHDALTRDASSGLECESILIAALRRLLERHADARAPEPIRQRGGREIARVLEYLHAHFVEEIRLAELSSCIGWSSYRLIRAFHREVGMPPHAYQNVLRVGRAQAMLRRGSAIADAAHACGFCDQSHMNRVFRRVLGTSPGRYRQDSGREDA